MDESDKLDRLSRVNTSILVFHFMKYAHYILKGFLKTFPHVPSRQNSRI